MTPSPAPRSASRMRQTPPLPRTPTPALRKHLFRFWFVGGVLLGWSGQPRCGMLVATIGALIFFGLSTYGWMVDNARGGLVRVEMSVGIAHHHHHWHGHRHGHGHGHGHHYRGVKMRLVLPPVGVFLRLGCGCGCGQTRERYNIFFCFARWA